MVEGYTVMKVPQRREVVMWREDPGIEMRWD